MKTNYRTNHFKRKMINKPSLLIIDTDIRFSISVSLKLESEMNVLTVMNGKDGLAAMNTQSFSVIVLDLNLHDMSGLEVLVKIREKSRDVHVLIVTSKSCHEWAVRCADLSVQGYLEKPIDYRDLTERIKKMIGNDHVRFLQSLWNHEYETITGSISYTVRKVIDYIHQHYQRDFSRDEVAVHVNLSSDYLSRLFHKECGIRLKDYITQFRIFKSKELLAKYPHMKVKNIAALVGISDSTYFCRFFKKHTGLTCRSFKKNLPHESVR